MLVVVTISARKQDWNFLFWQALIWNKTKELSNFSTFTFFQIFYILPQFTVWFNLLEKERVWKFRMKFKFFLFIWSRSWIDQSHKVTWQQNSLIVLNRKNLRLDQEYAWAMTFNVFVPFTGELKQRLGKMKCNTDNLTMCVII